tara:strand:- start:9 stop:1142 length:1134 start_codon:yes stop_codon:yes gene_type:complete
MNLDLLPQTTKGTRFGWSFIKLYKTCEMRWFNQYLRPHPAGGTGTEATTISKPLYVGDLFHHGVEHWYLSGWEDGSYDVDCAISALRDRAKERQPEVPDTDWADWTGQAEDLLLHYHQFYGPGGLQPEYPQYQVACDNNGEPLIEREFVMDMGYPYQHNTGDTAQNYVFTSRIDACMMFNNNLIALETKTVDTSRVSRLMLQFQVDGQCSGEIWLLRSAFPEVDNAGLHLNMIVKRAGKGKDPFRREPYHRSDIDLEAFRISTVRTLRRIDNAIGEYTGLIDKGVEIDEAARRVFDSYPDGFSCSGNFACDYLFSCMSRGHETSWFRMHSKARSEEGMVRVHGGSREAIDAAKGPTVGYGWKGPEETRNKGYPEDDD